MILALLAVAAGLALLVWSAERFVAGSSAVAAHLSVPPLLVGMVVVGFGTSAPELLVSALAAAEGSPGIALGNAYGSNIANIALILGVTALVSPIAVRSRVLRRELPLLLAATLLAAWQVRDGIVSRGDAVVLLVVFAGVIAWTIRQGRRTTAAADLLAVDAARELAADRMPFRRAVAWLVVGLVLLIVASRVLVLGAVEIAGRLGVSDLLVGLTIIAVGTSLPELASSVTAARRGEHEIAFGNVLGSNLFNTLAVVGLAGAIRPVSAGPQVLSRDVLVMGVLTLAMVVLGAGLRGRPGRIDRIEGAGLVLAYGAYLAVLVRAAGAG